MGGKTMQQIAYEVGFATSNHFNRVFRQITGVSPNAFVKMTESLSLPETGQEKRTQL